MLSKTVAVAMLGALVASAPVVAHRDKVDEGLMCHSSCEGAPPSHYKHKHPGGKCDELKLCPTAELRTPKTALASAQE